MRLRRLIPLFACLVSGLVFSPAPMLADERNQIDFVYVQTKADEQNGKRVPFLGGWDFVLQSEVADLLDSGDFWAIKKTTDGAYLQDVKVHKSSSEGVLSGSGLSLAFKGNQFFQIVENIPVSDGDQLTWHGNIYVENRLYQDEPPVQRFKLEEQLSASARRTILTIVKFISIQALIEDAVANNKPSIVICGLHSISVNFSGTLTKQKADGANLSDDEISIVNIVKSRIENDVQNAQKKQNFTCPNAKKFS
jgi:hypothetical protein